MLRSETLRRTVLPALNLLGLVLLWELLTIWLKIPRWLLPGPSAIGTQLTKSASVLWQHSLVTLYESVAGFGLSVLLGVPLAIAIVWSAYLSNTIYPILLLFQSIPKTAIAPLFIIWFGHGTSSKVVVAFLVAFFPIVVDTVSGMVSVESEMLDLARSLKSSRWQEFRYIRLPNALPYFFSGARVAITLAVIGAVIGEFVGGSNGLGYLILLASSQLQTSLVFTCLIILSLQGIALFYGLGWIERLVLPWYTPEQEAGAIQAAQGGGG